MQTAILCWAAALITVIPGHHTAKSPVVRLFQYQVRPEYQAEFRKALGDYVNTSVNATGTCAHPLKNSHLKKDFIA